ncbi:heterocyst frequency control protein PatD [Chamaesiphon sp. VAR_48_metabat_135_sub]|uniref:heterocyst frequency control protein PatD n=1 Tax=Chamaesiphon sp. VAR_48_metabat_135_sub TaxID=2964699 RepID=UPI00286CA0EF|nr:heterocyst frequency control protein PatD [Chamaesiphon sp. VAR_48_metabat_135_sub]
MLPTEQILMWQQLFSLLSNLPADSIPDLKTSLSQAVEFFEHEILNQDLDRLPDPIAGKMRSYLTESHRLLRLLPIDLMFIAAARNPTTSHQRRQAYQDKLTLLLQYCQAVTSNS